MSKQSLELTAALLPHANLVTETTLGTPCRGPDGWLTIEYNEKTMTNAKIKPKTNTKANTKTTTSS